MSSWKTGAMDHWLWLLHHLMMMCLTLLVVTLSPSLLPSDKMSWRRSPWSFTTNVHWNSPVGFDCDGNRAWCLAMFCSFEQKPLILRLYGQGSVCLPHDDGWAELSQHFDLKPGARQIISVDIHRVQTSCGYGVPIYDYKEQRPTLTTWAKNKGPDVLAAYQQQKGSVSIDGLVTPIGETNQG